MVQIVGLLLFGGDRSGTENSVQLRVNPISLVVVLSQLLIDRTFAGQEDVINICQRVLLDLFWYCSRRRLQVRRYLQREARMGKKETAI